MFFNLISCVLQQCYNRKITHKYYNCPDNCGCKIRVISNTYLILEHNSVNQNSETHIITRNSMNLFSPPVDVFRLRSFFNSYMLSKDICSRTASAKLVIQSTEQTCFVLLKEYISLRSRVECQKDDVQSVLRYSKTLRHSLSLNHLRIQSMLYKIQFQFGLSLLRRQYFFFFNAVNSHQFFKVIPNPIRKDYLINIPVTESLFNILSSCFRVNISEHDASIAESRDHIFSLIFDLFQICPHRQNQECKYQEVNEPDPTCSLDITNRECQNRLCWQLQIVLNLFNGI